MKIQLRPYSVPVPARPALIFILLGLAVTFAGSASAINSDVTIIEHTVPPFSEPYSITVGPDGKIWYNAYNRDIIARLNADLTITEFPLRRSDTPVTSITAGPDGNLWFTETFETSRIGRITPEGKIKEFRVIADEGPFEIVAGLDGNLWFTESRGNKIGRITPDGIITEFPLPRPRSDPAGITVGPDGNLWFAEEFGGAIGRITYSGEITEFPIPSTSGFQPKMIATGPDGNLWFTSPHRSLIVRMTVTGEMTDFPLSSEGEIVGGPLAIMAGSDGNMWFTSPTGNYIGRITTDGVITRFPLAQARSWPNHMTTDQDGNIWFTQLLADKLGKIEMAGLSIRFVVRTKKKMIIHGTSFPDDARVLINGVEQADRVKSVSKTVIKLKGKAKQLGLNPGDNSVQVLLGDGTLSNIATVKLQD
jgi:virginiamycin B lyase